MTIDEMFKRLDSVHAKFAAIRTIRNTYLDAYHVASGSYSVLHDLQRQAEKELDLLVHEWQGAVNLKEPKTVSGGPILER